MLIPLYGFLEGDTMGVLLLARADMTVRELAALLVQSATLRVAPPPRAEVVYKGHVLDPALTVARAGLAPLERVDVRRAAEAP